MASDRRHYWEAVYPTYWLKRVAETSGAADGDSNMVAGDGKVMGERALHGLLDLVPIEGGQRVLDLACGFGRSFPYILERGAKVTGVDLSRRILAATPTELRLNPSTTQLLAESEHLPFSTGSFDHVLVVDSFDAFDPNNALFEMLRVCRQGGDILFNAKHASYCEDDEQALVAERNARRNGHPNHFAHFDELLGCIAGMASVVKCIFFVRRRDLASLRFVETRPEKFYSFALVLRRQSDPVRAITKPIASEFSETWKTLHRS